MTKIIFAEFNHHIKLTIVSAILAQEFNSKVMRQITRLLALTICAVFLFECSSKNENDQKKAIDKYKTAAAKDPMKNKGIGPVQSVVLNDIDQKMVEDGKVLYDQLCTACHKIEKKFIGPSPKGIMDRRSPEWIMNMIMNPEEMTKNDPIAKQLLIEANGAPMANQNVSEEDARKILEYFRTL